MKKLRHEKTLTSHEKTATFEHNCRTNKQRPWNMNVAQIKCDIQIIGGVKVKGI